MLKSTKETHVRLVRIENKLEAAIELISLLTGAILEAEVEVEFEEGVTVSNPRAAHTTSPKPRNRKKHAHKKACPECYNEFKGNKGLGRHRRLAHGILGVSASQKAAREARLGLS